MPGRAPSALLSPAPSVPRLVRVEAPVCGFRSGLTKRLKRPGHWAFQQPATPVAGLAFERLVSRFEVHIMQPHQQRVMDEKDALDGNVERLTAFLEGDTFRTLGVADQVDLRVQLEQMTAYSNTLGRRIARF